MQYIMMALEGDENDRGWFCSLKADAAVMLKTAMAPST